MLAKFFSMGPLRNALQITAVVFALLMPFANAPTYSNNWNLIFAGVLPACAPIVVIVLMLDVMMSQVWKDGADDARVAQLNLIIKVHCATAAFLLAAFLAVFLPVLVP